MSREVSRGSAGEYQADELQSPKLEKKTVQPSTAKDKSKIKKKKNRLWPDFQIPSAS